MNQIPMPRLSDSMEEGTILRWIAKEGQTIERGEELAEIETDKASMVYEADAGGVLHILAQEGETLAIGAPIAQLLAEGEQPAEPSPAPAAGKGSAAAQKQSGDGADAPAGEADAGAGEADAIAGGADGTTAAAANDADTHAREHAAPAGEAAAGAGAGSPPAQASSGNGQDSGRADRVRASPLARRLASESGLDLAAIAGSGPGGRVVKADVERAQADETAAPADRPRASAGRPPAPAARPLNGEREIVQLSRTQALIARRMAEAKATIPEFTLQRDIEMDAAVQMRSQLKRLAQRRESPAPSYNDLVVKACALALTEHPRANGTYKDGAFELHPRVNIGVAVATADALLVPVVKDADQRSVWEIAAETRRLAAAVREGTITPPELSGATFSISNLGMYGIDSFAAVINPPQAAILAVGALAQRPVVRDGAIVPAHTMSVTLTCDHRILYGADAAELLRSIGELLRQPLALLA